MVDVTESAELPYPVEEVFAAAADPMTQLRWDAATLKRVERIGSGPLARGSRYRGEFKGFGQVEYVFAEYDPPRTFSHEARVRPGTMYHVFTFEPADGGTRMIQRGRLAPNLLGRLMAPMMRRMLAKRFRTIASELDAYLASEHRRAG